MDIATRVRELGGVTSAVPLISETLQLPAAAWLQDQLRQERFSAHRQTQSVVLLFCEGEWPEVQIEKRAGWDYLAREAVPVMQELLDGHYVRGGVILRAMVAKLEPSGTIPGHIDRHPSFACAHRIHVPLLTNPDVVFLVGGKQITMDVGKAYEINNQLTHRVYNGGDTDRIHFIFDYAPPDYVERDTDTGPTA